MKNIKIEIIIPEHELRQCTEYQLGGLELASKTIKDQISDILKQDYIKYFEIKATIED